MVDEFAMDFFELIPYGRIIKGLENANDYVEENKDQAYLEIIETISLVHLI